MYRAGDYAAAAARYTEAIALASDSAVYFGNRAAVRMTQRRYAEALRDSERAIELDEDYVKGYLRGGRAQLAAGQASRARRHLQAALIRGTDKDVDAALQGLEQCDTFQRASALGKKWLSSGDGQRALEEANKALAVAPAAADMVRLKVGALLTQKQYDEAAAFSGPFLPAGWAASARDAVAASGSSASGGGGPTGALRHALAEHRALQERLGNAADDIAFRDADLAVLFAKALHLNGHYQPALRVLEVVLQEAAQHKHALREVERLRLMEKKRNAGNDLFRKGRYAAAYVEYTAALAVHPAHDHYCATGARRGASCPPPLRMCAISHRPLPRPPHPGSVRQPGSGRHGHGAV